MDYDHHFIAAVGHPHPLLIGLLLDFQTDLGRPVPNRFTATFIRLVIDLTTYSAESYNHLLPTEL